MEIGRVQPIMTIPAVQWWLAGIGLCDCRSLLAVVELAPIRDEAGDELVTIFQAIPDAIHQVASHKPVWVHPLFLGSFLEPWIEHRDAVDRFGWSDIPGGHV